MAKKKKDDEGHFPQGDVADAEARRAESENPDVRQDGDDEADPDAPAERPAGTEEFQVVEPGTIIEGQYYPRSRGPEHEKMMAFLSPDQAQALVDCGVRLKKDNKDMEPTPKEENEDEKDLEARPHEDNDVDEESSYRR